MNGGEQDSGKSVWHSKLSATVPEFVPRIARIKVTSSGDLVINSNLSPLVPEFHPSVSPGSSPPRSVHGLQQPSKQACVNLHQAYQTTFPPSMKNILVKAESSGSEKRKEGNCEGHDVMASGTDESSTGNSVKVKMKKKQRKKNESSGLITKQENTGVPVSCDTITGDQLHSDASLNDDNSARSKAKEVSSSTQQNDILLLSHHENSSANTDSTVTANFEYCNTVNQPSSLKEPYAVSTLTVSYSDKVKSSSPKGNSTSNHLGAEKTRTNHFTSESFKRKDKPVDLKKRSEFCHSQSPGTVSSNNDGKKPVKSGQKSDDSSWKTVCRDNDDNKLKDVDSSRSQSTDAKHNQRTVKQMRRNGSFKKTRCDDDDNWRVRKDVDPTSVSRKKEINKSNIKDSDTGSLEKRTCYQEEKIIDLISSSCQDLKHENVVGHKVVDKKGIASKKLQNFHSIDSSGTEFTQSSSFLISKARSDVSEDIQERGIKPIRMSTIPDADSNLVMAEFPEFKESVKVKRLSITTGGTKDHKDEVTSPKATAPLSYSAVLRSPPQLKVMHAWENESASKTCGGLLKVPPPQTTMTEVENESNQEESNEKKKKKKKKKKTGETKKQTQESGSTKRTQKPIQFDLGVMLQTITKSSSDKPQQSNKKLVISTGVLPSQLSVTVSPDMKPVKAFPQLKGENKKVSADVIFQQSIPHNTLDSTAPVVKRGKERETPARKKPSALKKIILKEREEKKKAKKTTETGDADKTSDEKENITFEAEAKVTVQEIQNTLEDDAVTQVDSKPSSPTHQEIAAEIHSRRFREYCFQVPDKEVDGVATDLLRELVRFQDRQFHKDPVKAKAKRRFVLGLREVHKHLKLRRLKCVIISSNVERIQSSGGLDDTLGSIINLCRENNVPVVFALKRQMLGRVLLKKVPVSIVGIFNYDGAQDHFKKLIELTQKTKQAYTDRWEETREKLELQQQETSGVKTAEMDMVPNAGLQQAGVQHTTKEAAESTDDEESDANKENDSDSERDVFIENELEIQDL